MQLSFVKRDALRKADAIVILSGNGLERVRFGIDLYEKGMGDTLVLIGATGSRSASEMAKYAALLGVPENRIMVGLQSRNTKENAIEVLRIALREKWHSVILVTSPHHQLRAYLTFKKAWSACPDRPAIINYPPTEFSWFDLIEKSRATNEIPRIYYILIESCKIIKYFLKGDL